ncbi:Deoxyribodipyrimidine photo-lyase [Listeria grayi]|uniref:Deoxyribodipyrimidine photo-lyase n=1 Tax=Listeria grayi TaxID=1641 RepID=A0A378MHR0_LISGR|nr:deoxyribodipyrimidine photo-lyase [Listeria grayi]STY45063.1 Deoxyribodipyrimidine photo-lyase [Listeria grayi]
MQLGVLLNRVFRTKHNPLFSYVEQNRSKIDACYFIIPLEDLKGASERKKAFYFGTVNQFLTELAKYEIRPFLVTYEKLPEFCQKQKIDTILMAGDIMSYHQEEYDIRHQREKLTATGLKIKTIRVQHYFHPRATFKNGDEPYKVFTPFYKANRPHVTIQKPAAYSLKQLSEITVTGTGHLDHSYPDDGLSEEQAVANWQTFLNESIEAYETNREVLAEIKTSWLSVYLAYGLIDIQQIFNQLLDQREANEKNYEAFIRELLFREFYYVLMVTYPEMATQSFKPNYRQIEWSLNKANFERWKKGETGYPIVDAAMQELNQTGYMHNRMRMVVSQFLTKDLFIDWRWGEDYFRSQLIDYDNASNVNGWQWSASTGTDAVPYFRMFNPIRQSERFDQDGAYIKQYLPIFKAVPAAYLHDTEKNKAKLAAECDIELGKTYPAPIVDHKQSRQAVMEKLGRR